MAGSLSDFAELELLDHLFGGASYSPPATLYFAAFTSNPGDAGGGTEVTGNNYSRVAVTNNATNFPAAASGAKSNGTLISFAQASGAWGTVTAIGVFDAASAGNLLAWGTLSSSQAVGSGGTLQIPVGDFDVTLD